MKKKKKIIKGYRDDWEFMKISEMFGTLKGDVFIPLRKMLWYTEIPLDERKVKRIFYYLFRIKKK